MLRGHAEACSPAAGAVQGWAADAFEDSRASDRADVSCNICLSLRLGDRPAACKCDGESARRRRRCCETTGHVRRDWLTKLNSVASVKDHRAFSQLIKARERRAIEQLVPAWAWTQERSAVCIQTQDAGGVFSRERRRYRAEVRAYTGAGGCRPVFHQMRLGLDTERK